MAEYALRKSHGPHSAGTRVTLVEQPGKTRTEYTVYTLDGPSFVVPASDLVELRPRSTVVPLRNKAARRADKRKALEVIGTIQSAMHKEGMI